MTPKKRTQTLLILLVAAIVLAGLKHFGRPIWSPLVATARGEETVASVVERLRVNGCGLTEADLSEVQSLTLIGLKDERSLEVWAHRKDGRLEKIRTYPFTGYSGKLGPKLREGDLQIPEGVYAVEYLNPNSNYHLSIKIDYPNAFDREKGEADKREQLGGEIFIHGRSVTIGCIPIGDEAIEDLFTLASQIGIKKIAVILAPYDFRKRDERPIIEAVEWEDELYETVTTALTPFTLPPPD